MKHTPGPWKVNRGRRGSLGQSQSDMKPFTFIQTDFHASGHIKNGPEAAICEMRTGEHAVGIGGGNSFFHDITADEVEANARLMAASPDLFTACALFLAVWDSNAYNAEEMQVALQDHGVVDSMRSAIDKAKAE